MMRKNKTAVWLGTAAFLSGCTTTLGVQRAPEGNFGAGIPASLSFTRYEITATWRLATCPNRPGERPEVVAAVEATAGAEDDPDQSYLIDANSLQGPLNTSQFNVTYHENSGSLRTVNAEVEDRSAAVIGNVVRTAVALAPLALGRGPTAALMPAESSTISCDPQMVTALATVSDLEAQLETTNGQVATATTHVASLAAAATRMNGAIDPGTSQRYGDALDNLERLISAQTVLATQLADALKPLTFRRVIRWPDNGTELVRSTPVSVGQAALDRWFGRGSSAPEDWPEAFFAIERVTGSQPAQAGALAIDRGARVAGIPYRILVRGRLVTCSSLCRREGEGRTVVEGPVAQLGGVNLLPVRNPPFGSTSFAAEFRRDGTLVSAGYAQRTAPLEQATGAIAGAAESVGPLLDPTARLTSQTAYLQALQQRRDALAALQPASVEANTEAQAALTAETTLMNAQISNLQARITLQELQARLGGN